MRPQKNLHGRLICPEDNKPLALPNPNHPQEDWDGNGLVCPRCGRRWLSDGTEIAKRLDQDLDASMTHPDEHPTLALRRALDGR